ncbi:MAG: PilZ domain-containing protein [Caldimicrobium sp.]
MIISIEQRRFPRFFTKILAYFPGDDKGYPVKNVSWKGLFIKTDKFTKSSEKFIYLELEIPEIGRIPIYGTIVHYGTPEEPGLGIEILEIDKNLAPVWNIYIKILSYLKEAKEKYEVIMTDSETQEK